MKRILTLIFPLIFITASGQKTVPAEAPVKTVERIFRDYTRYSESTDSPDDKEAIKKALIGLQQSANEKDLPLLIDVWMYYDPTDFPVRQLIEPIFYKYNSAATDAINKRIKKKKKWERKDTAPYAELFELKNKLAKNM